MRRTIDRLQAARRDQNGFTLIELLIVIIILGVLAAIVVFSVRAITDTGEAAACEANEKTALTAIEAYYAQENDYPASMADLVADGYLADDPSVAAVDAQIRVGYTRVAGPPVSYTLTNGTAC